MSDCPSYEGKSFSSTFRSFPANELLELRSKSIIVGKMSRLVAFAGITM